MKKNISIIMTVTAIILLIAAGIVSGQDYTTKQLAVTPLHYTVDFRMDFKQGKLYGIARIKLRNTSGARADEIPLLLYRMIKVTAVTASDGSAIPFTQQIMPLQDYDLKHVTYVNCTPETGIPPGGTYEIIVTYEGYLRGYMESSGYIHDSIDPSFTILREDTNCYPLVGYPSYACLIKYLVPSMFDYLVSVSVPDTLNVANCGKLESKTADGSTVTYIFSSVKPSWRMDFAIAKYRTIQDGNVKIYCFPEDYENGLKIMQSIKKTVALYSGWFGPLKEFSGFSLIEIPDGWGSQTDAAGIIQAAAAFKNLKLMYEVYHELAHLWNTEWTDPVPPRLEEGVSMFLQYLTLDRLEQKHLLHDNINRLYTRAQKSFNRYEQYRSVPIAQYGSKQATRLSYTVGGVFFYIMYRCAGEEQFTSAFKSAYDRFYGHPASTKEYFVFLDSKIDADLSRFYNDWLYSAKYTAYFLQNKPLEDVVKVYLGK